MLRPLALGSFVTAALVVAAACGGAIAEEDVDGGARSSSSGATSSGSTSSGAVGVRRDGGSVRRDAGQGVGFVACPDQYDRCGTESGGALPMDCCVEGFGYSCREPGATCMGTVLRCDEGADCNTGVCCAEEAFDSPISSRRLITTQCRPTCITALPRVRVCTTNADCDGTTCREWKCGGYDMMGIKTCEPLGPCD
ncbi:MAG: hypothetical protein KIT84_17440 [Labilithrix sp.]|nr:hypothetical protein [Labilithrix sp.]MCW5812816.1 hypothetical protein [Labilithrix sp.]